MNVELVRPILGFGKGCDSLDRRTLAKEITSIEEGLSKPEIGKGLIIGITGAPGVGKSCLIDALLHCWTPELKVAVLAVDPSSPISGGALLGDRIRMTALDDSERRDRIYLRSLATRSASGSTPYVVSDLCSHLLARDFDLVISRPSVLVKLRFAVLLWPRKSSSSKVQVEVMECKQKKQVF